VAAKQQTETTGNCLITSGLMNGVQAGKTQKFLDLDLTLPSTGERACVQIKSETTSAQLAEYVEQLSDAGEFYKMFYVYHSGEAVTDDERVKVIGPEKLAELVFDAGLTSWLIDKVS
jgi:rhamnogalacturonyl hydrolase YesR